MSYKTLEAGASGYGHAQNFDIDYATLLTILCRIVPRSYGSS